MTILLFVLLLTVVNSSATVQKPPTATDTVHNVTYIGNASNGVESFQGIRYGADTSGENRFKHPRPFTYLKNSVVNATTVSPACPQRSTESLLGVTSDNGITSESEDCLRLMITRPKGTPKDAGLPVMVWIYGGGDENGNINVPLYDPAPLVSGAVEKGLPVIFASMNYRVNIFGFANNKALREEGSLNSGLFDQRLALQWIQSNIRYFGGDGSSITIFGQSDGGTSVGLHMTAYGGKGKVAFHRAIMQSGSPAADPGVSGNLTAVSTSTVASLVGCENATDSQLTLSCLRKLPMEDLLQGVLEYENQTAADGLAQDIFFPTTDDDLIPGPPSQLLKQGKFHKNISVITGWAENDGSIFSSPEVRNDSAAIVYLSIQYPHLTPATVQELLHLYPASDFTAQARNADNPNGTASFFQSAQIYRDINFACPALDTAFRVAAHGAPAYIYALNQTALTLLLDFAGVAYYGVIHVSDIPYVFDNTASVLGSANDAALASRMSGSWVSFARTGEPTTSTGRGNATGNETLNDWPYAFGGQQHLLNLAAKNGTVMPSSAVVRVIGGPSGGIKTYGTSGPEQLIKRCSFINSAGFYAQIQT